MDTLPSSRTAGRPACHHRPSSALSPVPVTDRCHPQKGPQFHPQTHIPQASIRVRQDASIHPTSWVRRYHEGDGSLDEPEYGDCCGQPAFAEVLANQRLLVRGNSKRLDRSRALSDSSCRTTTPIPRSQSHPADLLADGTATIDRHKMGCAAGGRRRTHRDHPRSSYSRLVRRAGAVSADSLAPHPHWGQRLGPGLGRFARRFRSTRHLYRSSRLGQSGRRARLWLSSLGRT